MLGFFPLRYLSLISYQGERRRSKAPRLLFTQRRRRGILGSPYPRSCIAPPLSGRGRAYCPARAPGGAHKMWGCWVIMRLDASPKAQSILSFCSMLSWGTAIGKCASRGWQGDLS